MFFDETYANSSSSLFQNKSLTLKSDVTFFWNTRSTKQTLGFLVEKHFLTSDQVWLSIFQSFYGFVSFIFDNLNPSLNKCFSVTIF